MPRRERALPVKPDASKQTPSQPDEHQFRDFATRLLRVSKQAIDEQEKGRERRTRSPNSRSSTTQQGIRDKRDSANSPTTSP